MSREALPCFNCQKHGHWSVNCPEKSIRKHETSSFNVQDDRIPCKKCPCGAGTCLVLTSKTQKNLGRKFYKCPLPPGTKCNFFEWCNTAISDQRREVPQQAFSCPECPCGAGKSSLLTVSKEGPNKGRQFFVCPVRGGTKCNFFEWCDTAISNQRREVPQQVFSYPECPCGAGTCSRLTVVKEGQNKGRKYFVCPVKRGQGACNFFRWEDDEGNDRNDDHLGERKPSNSSLSTINGQEETRETNSYSVKDEDVNILDEGLSDEKQSESLSSVGPDVKEMIEIYSDVVDDSLSTPMHKLSLSEDKRAVTPTKPGNCFRCGREGHWIRDCSIRATNSVCVKCGRFGHWKKDCTA